MIESLHRLISGRGFDEFRVGLEKRFRASRLIYKIHYGAPPSSSLFVRLESKERIGEICAWESGNCEVQLAEFGGDQVKTEHHKLESDHDFHARLSEVLLFVTARGPIET